MKKSVVVLLVALMLFSAVACQAPASEAPSPAAEDQTADSGTEPAVAGDKKVVGISFSSEQDDSFFRYKNFLIEGFEAIGWEVLYLNADADATKQASDINDLISQSADVIVSVPQDSSMIGASVKESQDAGIPIIITMRPMLQDAEYMPNVNTVIDAYAQGYNSMKATVDKMMADGIAGEDIKVIAVSGDAKDENSVQRMVGCQDALDEVGAEMVTEIPTDWDPERAQSGIAAAIQAYPEANAMFYAADILLDGGIVSMESAGVWVPYGEEGFKYYIATCDGYLHVVNEYIRDGYVVSDTLFDIYSMSGVTIESAQKLADGEEMQGEIIAAEVPTYTAENWDSDEMQELLELCFG